MIHEIERPFKSDDGRGGRFAFPPKWLTYPEAEHICGLSRVTLWRYISAGHIDAARVGRAVRISRASLEAFMRSKVEA